jgi:hypothetical protein
MKKTGFTIVRREQDTWCMTPASARLFDPLDKLDALPEKIIIETLLDYGNGRQTVGRGK